MAKLHIGKVVEQLNGEAITHPDGTPFVVKDLIANIISSALNDIAGREVLILRGVGTDIVRSDDEYIELKGAEFKLLRDTLKKEFIDKKGVGNVLTKAALLDALDEADRGSDDGATENG